MTRLKQLIRQALNLATAEERERRLRAENLLREESYRAVRSFEVEQYEDEGRHLFVELVGGSVLYLTGQYLYDYGIDPDGTPDAGSDTFPASSFDLVFHRTQGHLFRIVPSGMKLPPVETFPPYQPGEYERGLVPEDLDVISSHTFDELLANEGRLLRSTLTP